MRKQLYRILPALAAATLLAACGGQKAETTAAPDSSAASTAEAGSAAAAMDEVPALSADEYVFVKMNVPYADYYYGELKDVQPEAYSKDAKAQLDKADAVEAAGFRKEGEYDAVTSPTVGKYKKFKGAYAEEQGETSVYNGVAEVNVAIAKPLYEDAKKAIEEKKEAKNPILTLVGNVTGEESAQPAEYKVLNSDGTLSKTFGKVTKAADVKASITTTSNYGNYELDLKGIDVDPDNMQGAILETSDGAKYGLKHLDNLWLKPEEIAFSAVAFEDKSHKSAKQYERFADIGGKTIKKVTYLVKDGDDVEVDLDLFVKNQAPADYAVTGDEKVTYSAEGTKINYQLNTGSDEYKLERVVYRRADSDVKVDTATAGVLALPKEAKPGTYQFIFTNDKLSDVSFSCTVDSGLSAEDFSFADNKLSLKENAQGLTVADYLKTTSSAKIGETEYKGGKGRKFGTTAFNEDGSVKLDATTAGDNGDVKVFDGASSYPVTLTADGYPELSFTVEAK